MRGLRAVVAGVAGVQTRGLQDRVQRIGRGRLGPPPVRHRAGTVAHQARIALVPGTEGFSGLAEPTVVFQVAVAFAGNGEFGPPLVHAVPTDPDLEVGLGKTQPLDHRPVHRFQCRLGLGAGTVDHPPGVASTA